MLLALACLHRGSNLESQLDDLDEIDYDYMIYLRNNRSCNGPPSPHH